jgi:hypothetical protein
MTVIHFVSLPTQTVRAYQDGGVDAYGEPPERRISDGSGLPCRHCLTEIIAGDEYLVLAHRPFSTLHPYAETGPIFLHAKACARHPESEATPTLLLSRERVLIRGYGLDERIIYGTGKVVETERIGDEASAIFDNPDVAFVDVRSASNNCYQCRIVRAQ